jgi:hypothetical protein
MNQRVIIQALQSVMPYKPGLHTNLGNSTARSFRQKLLMGTLATIPRQHNWRPDLFLHPTCLRCRSGQEDSDHLFVCPANTLSPDIFVTRFREELEAVLPNQPGDARTLADVLLASGLSLLRFRGVLIQSLSALICPIPVSLSASKTCLAILQAMHRVAYADVWKPRCSAALVAERALGITALMKRAPPAARAPAQVPVEPGAAAVTHSLREHAVALGRSHVRDRAIFRGALYHLLCSPPLP